MKLEIWRKDVNGNWYLPSNGTFDYGLNYAERGKSVNFVYPPNGDAIVTGSVTCTFHDAYVDGKYSTNHSLYKLQCVAGRPGGYRNNIRVGILRAGWSVNGATAQAYLQSIYGDDYENLNVCRENIEYVPGDNILFGQSDAPDWYDTIDGTIIMQNYDLTFRIFVCVNPFEVYFYSDDPSKKSPLPSGRTVANMPDDRGIFRWRTEPYGSGYVVPDQIPTEVIPTGDNRQATTRLGKEKNLFTGWKAYLSLNFGTSGTPHSDQLYLERVKPG